MGIFSCQNFNGIGLEFDNLVKIKHMWYVFHSVIGPELEFEGKDNCFSKTRNTSKISLNLIILTKMNIFCEIAIFSFKLKLWS